MLGFPISCSTLAYFVISLSFLYRDDEHLAKFKMSLKCMHNKSTKLLHEICNILALLSATLYVGQRHYAQDHNTPVQTPTYRSQSVDLHKCLGTERHDNRKHDVSLKGS